MKKRKNGGKKDLKRMDYEVLKDVGVPSTEQRQAFY